MKILTVVGARPQFIKEAIVQKEMKKWPNIEEVLVHTGQHYDAKMSGDIFSSLEIDAPKYHLDINRGSHGQMTGKMLIKIEEVLLKEEPDVVLVYGDTNSTLAAALAAAKLKIPVAHVEAGLRQNPKDMPEEINRQLTDRISKHLYVPSLKGIENLKLEGLEQRAVFTGDVMYDLYLEMEPYFNSEIASAFSLEEDKYILLTLHRDFNVDDRFVLQKILENLKRISEFIPIVFPIHPRTRQRILKFNLSDYLSNFKILEPLDYLDLMGLVQNAKLIITDSGGLQKESYFAGRRSLIVMPDTGWIELIEEGINKLTKPENLYSKFTEMSSLSVVDKGIYGKGNASEIIVRDLISHYDKVLSR